MTGTRPAKKVSTQLQSQRGGAAVALMIVLITLPGLLTIGTNFVAIVTNLGAFIDTRAAVTGGCHSPHLGRNMPHGHPRGGLRAQDPIRAEHEDQEHTQ
jgi:hypothetical protein